MCHSVDDFDGKVFGLEHNWQIVRGTSLPCITNSYLQKRRGSLENARSILPTGNLYGPLRELEIVPSYIGILRESPERTDIPRVPKQSSVHQHSVVVT